MAGAGRSPYNNYNFRIFQCVWSRWIDAFTQVVTHAVWAIRLLRKVASLKKDRGTRWLQSLSRTLSRKTSLNIAHGQTSEVLRLLEKALRRNFFVKALDSSRDVRTWTRCSAPWSWGKTPWREVNTNRFMPNSTLAQREVVQRLSKGPKANANGIKHGGRKPSQGKSASFCLFHVASF